MERKRMKKNWLDKMLSPNSGVSSKRVCGVAGWIVCIGLVIFCTITQTPSPDALEMLFICATSLLGVDSVTSIWKKNVNK
jgi:hypothetical protein